MSEQSVAQACAEGRPVAVKFEAPWCGDCVGLNDALARRPLEGLTELTLDADSDAAAPVVARLAILELPTLVVLAPDGAERGRVVGFSSWGDWRRELDAVMAGSKTLEALALAAASGRDAQLAYAEALLSRDAKSGLAALEALAGGDDDTAAEALHCLGRYLQRARREPESACSVWLDLLDRFGEHPRAIGALIWYARAQASLGAAERASAVFAAQHTSRPRDAGLVLSWAAFAAQEGLESQRSVVREAAMKTLSHARGADRDHLENLVMKLSAPFVRQPAS